MRRTQGSKGRSAFAVAVVLALIGVVAIVVLRETVPGDEEPDPTAQSGRGAERVSPAAGLPAGPASPPAVAPNATPAPSNCGESGQPAATVRVAIVTAEVRLREGPGTNCRTIQFIPEGTEVQVLSEMFIDDDGNIWSRVRFVESGTEGWMGFTFLDVQSAESPGASG